VTEQLKVRRYFQIESPFENSCIHCKGTGEIYKFVKKTVEVNCHICAGKGELKITCPECKGKPITKEIQCPTCKGSGRYIRRWPEGGGINVSCRRCHGKKTIMEEVEKCEKCNGEKTVVVKCAECRGKGKKRKAVLDHTIKSTTPCPVCEELGFTRNIKPKKLPKPKPRHEPANPVIPQDLAGAIRAHIKQ
jgi:DnaJ-class molecular chaperone